MYKESEERDGRLPAIFSAPEATVVLQHKIHVLYDNHFALFTSDTCTA